MMKVCLTAVIGALALGGFAAEEPWVAALERSAVVFDRPNGGPCVKPLKSGGKEYPRHFTTGRPEYVMPVGAGNLSAMVSFGEDCWELHLSQADYYAATNGVTAPAVWSQPREVYMTTALRSPGHVQVKFAELTHHDMNRFTQRLDLLHGKVTLVIETPRGNISAEVFGDRATGALVVLVDDKRKGVAAPVVNQTMKPLRAPAEVKADGNKVKVAIGITAEAAKAALAADAKEQRAALERWWQDYWSRGWIVLDGEDRAKRLMQLWYVNLYVYGSVGYSEMPPKFNAGPGIVFGDERSWGDNLWWQNTREMIWPLAGANHADFARTHLAFFSGFAANSAGGWTFKTPPPTGNFVLPETAELNRHPHFGAKQCPERAHDAPYVSLTDEDRAKALKVRLDRRGNLKSHIYGSGAEYIQQLIEYLRYTGDKTMLPHVAKWLRGQTETYLRLCTREADGKWHIRCTNVNESWVKVDDSIVDLAGARYCFAQTVAHGAEFGFPSNFIADAATCLKDLADYPHGTPYVDYYNREKGLRLVDGPDVYHPCVLSNGMHKANFENNELYLIHPFAMAGVDEEGPRRQRAIDTYLNGPKRDGDSGWTPVSIAVTRMRLTNAADIVYGHAVRSCTWPYGGGCSPGCYLYSGSFLNASVYMDSTGVMQTGVQELLLQSHAEEPDPSFFTGGPVRLAPCVPESWSGAFKLCARGGFVIEATFRFGKLEKAVVTSERGNDFVWIDPTTGERRVRKTVAGETFTVEAPVRGDETVDFELKPTPSSLIRCRMFLPSPKDWDGRLWGTGNGGPAGQIDVGTMGTVINHFKGRTAVVNTDLGTSGGRAVTNREAWIDFAWRATHLMTEEAKRRVRERYGRDPDKCYFYGLSTGGGQGLHEAQQFPGDYDGIVACVPAHGRMTLAALNVWCWRQAHDEKGKMLFNPVQARAIAAAGKSFLRGGAPKYSESMAEKILAKAQEIEPSLKDAELARRVLAMWRGPEFFASGARIEGMSFGVDPWSKMTGNGFFFAWTPEMPRGKGWNVTDDATFEKLVRKYGPLFNGENPDLSAFAKHGGKLIMFAGLEDHIVPFSTSVDYWERAAVAAGGGDKLSEFLRLYLIPTLRHGSDRCYSTLDDIVAWVERGKRPETMQALENGTVWGVRPYPQGVKRPLVTPSDPVFVGHSALEPVETPKTN